MVYTTGVLNDDPVPRLEPPVAPAYQFTLPELATTEIVVDPESQRVAGVNEVITGVTLMVAVTAVLLEAHVLVDVST